MIGWYIVYGPLKCRRLSVLDKQVDIGLVISIDVESFLPSGAHSFRWCGYELVDECFHVLLGLYAKPFEHVNVQQLLVEFAYVWW